MNLIKNSILFMCILSATMACSGNNKEEADQHFTAGRYEEAIQAYTQKLQVDPSNVQVLYSRGRAYEELNNYEAAMEDFESALKYDDRNVKVLIGLGDVLYKQQKFENALYYYQMATDFESNHPIGLFKEGRAQHKLGNVKEAMSLYDAAIRENPNLGEAYLFRGALKVSRKDNAAACQDFRRAVELEVSEAAEAVTRYCK